MSNKTSLYVYIGDKLCCNVYFCPPKLSSKFPYCLDIKLKRGLLGQLTSSQTLLLRPFNGSN